MLHTQLLNIRWTSAAVCFGTDPCDGKQTRRDFSVIFNVLQEHPELFIMFNTWINVLYYYNRFICKVLIIKQKEFVQYIFTTNYMWIQEQRRDRTVIVALRWKRFLVDYENAYLRSQRLVRKFTLWFERKI